MINPETLHTLFSELFESTRSIRDGQVANYIPQLSRVNPEHYALALCLPDGTLYTWGDTEEEFCLQSVCKPLNYLLALEELGEEKVHQHVGFEPSGSVFNALTLNQQRLPHNPLINSGGIMCASLIASQHPIAERFTRVSNYWTQLSGGIEPGFDNAVYQSEKQHADRNYALGYFMQENKAFPPGTDLHEALDLYFQSCSLTLNVEGVARVAKTLAMGGLDPKTGQRLCSERSLRNLLSVMASCGMYNYSGEFAFRIGLPAKSGVSGALMVVVPGEMGIAIWSPRLDQNGNSVRGLAFCKALIEKLPLHVYDGLS